MSNPIVKHISWDVQDGKTIGYRYPERDIQTNSILEVGPGQVAVFVQYSEEGTATKTFPAGRYQLETELPVGEKKGFFRRLFSKATGTNIYQCDIYFFSADIKFTDLKWRTQNGPIDCGTIAFQIFENDPFRPTIRFKLRGFGSYGFHLVFDEFDDPDSIKTIVTNIMGRSNILTTADIQKMVTDRILENISNAFGDVVDEVDSKILNIGKYFNQLSTAMTNKITPILKDYAIALDYFTISQMDYPDDVREEIEKYEKIREERIAQHFKTQAAAEERMSGGYMQEKQIEVMKAAASNEGMAGTFMGAGMGLGMGVGMGNVFGVGMNNMAQGAMGNAPQMGMAPMGAPQQAPQQETCPQCGTAKQPNTNFCNNCGYAFGIKCPDCGTMLPTGTKFCGNCGHAFELKCPSCGTTLPMGTKFCGNCGTKL